MKDLKYRGDCEDFESMRMTFDDCVRYSQAEIIFIDSDAEPIYAEIEIKLKNPSMRKEAISLMLNRWKSCGFKLTEVAT